MQQYRVCYILLQNPSTCFVCQIHPLSGVHETVTTVSGTGHSICVATSLQRGQIVLIWPLHTVASRWAIIDRIGKSLFLPL
jgi:hypothetical protein